MCKTMTANAIKLKEYIDAIEDFRFIEPALCPYRNHIGALFTDTVLQTGLNYRSIVWPRVESVLTRFPEADTVSKFSVVLKRYGTRQVLNWNNQEKLRRMDELVSFCYRHSVETTDDLTLFLKEDSNVLQLKRINGIGDKTCDYIKRLLGFDTVAIDRHIRVFLEDAAIHYNDYYEMKEVVEFAADFLACSRRELDYSIWKYMSEKRSGTIQLSFDF